MLGAGSPARASAGKEIHSACGFAGKKRHALISPGLCALCEQTIECELATLQVINVACHGVELETA
jgi:hypothetical protein